jgi:pimeloyl-ACP methyl ester carboxylesterase
LRFKGVLYAEGDIGTRGYVPRRALGLRRTSQWRRPHAAYHSTQVQGYRVHWVEAGAGQPLVLLHGLCGSSRWWNANIPALSERFRVLAVDLVGFGRSRCAGPLPDIASLADLLARWIEGVAGTAAHLVGHSMGGHLAIHLAARHPERIARLVLADTAGLPRRLSPAAVARWVYQVAPPTRWGDPAFLPIILRDALRAGPVTAIRALRDIVADDVSPLLPRITSPTLILWGAGDTIIPLENALVLRERIEGARLEVIEGAFHNPMVDQPAAFNRAVLDFLDPQ